MKEDTDAGCPSVSRQQTVVGRCSITLEPSSLPNTVDCEEIPKVAVILHCSIYIQGRCMALRLGNNAQMTRRHAIGLAMG